MPHCQLPQVCPLVSAAKSPRAAGPPGPGTHTCVKELTARSSRDNSLVIANLHRQHPGWSLSTPRSWAKMAWRLRTAGRVSQSTGKYGRRETRAGRWGPLDSCPRHQGPPGIAHTRGRRKPALPDPQSVNRHFLLPRRAPQTTVVSPPLVTSQHATVEKRRGPSGVGPELQSPRPAVHSSAEADDCPKPRAVNEARRTRNRDRATCPSLATKGFFKETVPPLRAPLNVWVPYGRPTV